jgi:hypothetical protein
MQRKLIQLVTMLCLVTGLAVPAGAQEPTRVVADGTQWLQSSPEVRKAFIVGAGNMMALEAEYAKKRGTPAPLAGSKAAAAMENLTIDQISDRITRWYAAHPARRTVPVIGVIWMDMVAPDSSRK